MSRLIRLVLSGAAIGAVACSNSSSSPGSSTPFANSVPMVVNLGPTNDYANGGFVSVTLCEPGTSRCQTIDGVLVDTGSSGLRVLSSALTLNLAQETGSNGDAIVECNQFQDGYTWGPVQRADVKLASEVASQLPIQVIGAPGFSSVPNSCTSGGLAPEQTLDQLGANGVLGIGVFQYDCGPSCVPADSSNIGLYYTCANDACQVASTPLNLQLQNPVTQFSRDGNGVLIDLPAVSSLGAATISGTLVFGIGTATNNALGGAAVLHANANATITTYFQGRGYSGSFIDSGSNGMYFLDQATTGLALCSSNKQFYCPAQAQTFSATNGSPGNTPVTFTVSNAETLFNNAAFAVLPGLAGPNPGVFDWGLPFFYGRRVFTAIEGRSTPGGVGPYYAY